MASDDIKNQKAYLIKQAVENLEPGSKLTIMLSNDTKREYLTGEFVSITETFILINMVQKTLNKPNDRDVVGVPFGSMKYVIFDSLKGMVDGQ